MAIDNYSHLVEVDEKNRQLIIYRVADGRRDLFTSVPLPEGPFSAHQEQYAAFFRQLGENLIVDSPQARRLLQI